MKILVCGNGPSLLTNLKGKDLSVFDKVVRLNRWQPIEGYDNRCNAWAYYPLLDNLPEHDVKEIWNPHFSMDECFPRQPDYTISAKDTEILHAEMKWAGPTTGAVVVYMSILLGAETWISGFDFFQQGYHYFESESDRHVDACHNMTREIEWFKKKILGGKVQYFL